MVSAGRSVPVASSGLVPSQAVSRRLRPFSTVPVIGASCWCSESDEHEAGPRRSETERGMWRLIATRID
jgi:hypothetical protein